MYNKIASIILNSAKAAGLSDVFVAQPDSLKENLAGKIFVLAEIGGKKTETKKIFDFIVSSLGHNYYNDEKILFRDKIEGLKIENIFEAALTRTNKDLAEFLLAEKIKLTPTATSITLGVVFEDKLHFANFGHNRSVLIYQRGGNYELINVEANAAEFADNNSEDSQVDRIQLPKLFSSVISGEIPLGSYFLFGSEALLEYLSSKELVDIITKLPPMTAAEQIKNVLNKINNYVPFLGLIIKNTVGLSLPEFREETYANTSNSSAHSSISSLNYTEQKTEQMLAPAGLISFSKIIKNLKHWLGTKLTKPQRSKKKYSVQSEKNVQAPLDLGVVKSLNLARSDSFLKAEKIFFKHESNFLLAGFKKTLRIINIIFNKQSWQKFGRALKNSLISLNLKNRYLLLALGLVILVLVISLSLTNWSRQRRIVQENFDNLVSQIEEKNNGIATHLLYNDEEGASRVLLETQALLATLPQETKAQKAIYERLSGELKTEQEKIQKIVKAEPPVKINDLSSFVVKNITFAAGKIFASSDRLVYSFVPGSTSYVKTEITGVNSLQFLSFDKKDNLYYASDNKIIQFNIKTRANSSIIVNEPEPALSLGQARIFNSNLYALRASQNQIYRYTRGATSFGAKSAWLKEATNLNTASDLLVDGDIYVLQASGQVMKFFKGQKSDYKSLPVSPVMTQAQKILAGQNYIYIFEPISKRLVVLSRSDGHLTSQYIFDSLNSSLDFTVDESTKSVYFLASSSLWKVQLK
ncbi:MAG: hypothetical protein WC863_04135 [Patescibacteria group bacterium]